MLVERSPCLIGLFDRDGRFLYVNPSFRRAMDVASEDVIGKTIAEARLPGPGMTEIENALHRVLATGKDETLSLTSAGEKGSRSYRAQIVPLKDDENNVVGAAAHIDDVTRLISLETAAEKSSEHLKNIVETVPDGITIAERDGHITFANRAAEGILGLKRDSITLRYFNDPGWKITGVDGGPLPTEELPFARVMRTGEAVQGIEHAIVHPDGRRAILSINAAPVRDASGAVTGAISSITDITRKKEIENELRASEQRFRDVIDAAPFGAHFYELFPDGLLVFTGANPACARILQLDCSQFIGKTIEEAFPPLKDTPIPDAYRKTALTGEPYDQEQVQYKDQEISGAFEIHAFQTGRRRMAVLFRDITERKKAESQKEAALEALQRSEERYRSMVEVISDWIWEVDPDGRYTYASPKIKDILGYLPEEVIGKTPFDLMPPGETERVKEEFGRAVREQRAFYGLENVNRHRDGRRVVLETSGIPVFDGTGRFAGYRGIDRDITRRKKTESDLQTSYDTLQEATEGIILAISKIVETRDPYTAGHQRRVAQLASAIAKELGLSDRQARDIHVAGLLHDVGKIYVPAEILSKPGRLNEVETEMVRIHPRAGYEILRVIPFSSPVAEIAYQHQERLNGYGYPRQLTAEQILFETKIISVADTVEAMSFYRPYRAVIGLDTALEEIERGKNILYDERAVDACVTLFRKRNFRFER